MPKFARNDGITRADTLAADETLFLTCRANVPHRADRVGRFTAVIAHYVDSAMIMLAPTAGAMSLMFDTVAKKYALLGGRDAYTCRE